MKKLNLTIFLLPFFISILAQPINDDCPGIINLGTAPICPVIDTFTNVNATASVVFSDPSANIPLCFNSGNVERDVWFQFTAPLDISDFTVTVTGVDWMNDAIVQPQIAVYRGDCLLDELVELGCATSNANANEISIDLMGLTPNITYFLRINDWTSSASPNWGDFVLCVAEFVPDYIMGEDTETTACSGTLFDSGGADGDYQTNENFTFTICPNELTGCINLDLVSYNLENNFDFLNIFAGDGLDGPQMTNLSGSGMSVPLMAGDNCVTIQFTSDVSIVNEGFELTWQCEAEDCNTTLIPCLQTQPIFGLPFTSNNQTTCNSGDDVQTGSCDDSETLLAGEDLIYTYNPFNDACIDILITGADLNTGLSIYDDCPEFANNCLGFAQNLNSDTLLISGFEVSAFQQIFLSISNENCTDFNIQITEVPCPVRAPARPVCEDALLLNNCGFLPDVFDIAQVALPNPNYFQMGINDGCWESAGEARYTWLFFQAQTDGEFGFLADPSNDFENANLNFQVWGPISDFETMCEFIENNQPARSSGASNSLSNLTGLTNLNPLNNAAVTDNCEDSSGDGFVTTMPVQDGEFFLILLNDANGALINGGVEIDFSPTTIGVLDGLPEDTPLSAPEYTIIGDGFVDTQNFDFSCIQITAAQNTQLSCIWAEEQVNFFEPFSQNITVFLGNNDGGADGICMVYHQSVEGDDVCGISGGGIGASGIDNSFIIEFDTWQNVDFNDPFQDHISVNVNGDMANPIGGPAILPNIEDGQEHEVTFNWDPATMTYEVFFDGVLQITGVYDIVQNCFQGISMAYCGFTGSTGGANNLQYACTGDNIYPTRSLDSLTVNICEGESYFVGGALQTEAGFYTDMYQKENGCDSTIVTELILNEASSETIEITLCEGQIYFAGGAPQTTDGIYIDTLQSFIGCDSILMTDLTFVESESDTIDIQICEGETYFAGGENQTEAGTYTDNLLTTMGCDSVIVTNLEVIPANAQIEPAGEVSCENDFCISLDASNSTTGENVTYNWTSSGAGTISEGQNTLNPTICNSDDYTLELTNIINGLSCISTNSVFVAEDPNAICDYHIPNAFTPNGDEINNVFQLIDEGDSFEVLSLTIFNRWGEKVHDASGENHGWDGMFGGKAAPAEVYLFNFEIRAKGSGEVFVEKGDLTLIR